MIAVILSTIAGVVVGVLGSLAYFIYKFRNFMG